MFLCWGAIRLNGKRICFSRIIECSCSLQAWFGHLCSLHKQLLLHYSFTCRTAVVCILGSISLTPRCLPSFPSAKPMFNSNISDHYHGLSSRLNVHPVKKSSGAMWHALWKYWFHTLVLLWEMLCVWTVDLCFCWTTQLTRNSSSVWFFRSVFVPFSSCLFAFIHFSVNQCWNKVDFYLFLHSWWNIFNSHKSVSTCFCAA